MKISDYPRKITPGDIERAHQIDIWLERAMSAPQLPAAPRTNRASAAKATKKGEILALISDGVPSGKTDKDIARTIKTTPEYVRKIRKGAGITRAK